MVKSKFSISLIIFTLLLPSATSEIEINANAISISYGAPGYIFVVAGDNITFNATGIGNASSILWDFERDISGPDTRYSNLVNVSHVVHATGVYNITFTAFYGEEYVIEEFSKKLNYTSRGIYFTPLYFKFKNILSFPKKFNYLFFQKKL